MEQYANETAPKGKGEAFITEEGNFKLYLLRREQEKSNNNIIIIYNILSFD
jgi:hypothetical protein